MADVFQPTRIDPNTISSDFSLPPVEKDTARPEDEVFYTAALTGGDDPVNRYQDMLEEYRLKGESSLVNTVKNQYKEQKDLEKAVVVESIIADESIDKETKMNLLQEFAYGKYNSDGKVKDAFIDYYAQQKASVTYTPFEELELESVSLQTGKLKAYQEYDDIIDQASDIFLNKGSYPKLTDNEILDALDNLKLRSGAFGTDSVKEAVTQSLDHLASDSYGFGSEIMGNSLTAVKSFVIGLIPWLTEVIVSPVAAPFSELTVTEIREGVRDWWNNPYVGDWLKTEKGIDDLYEVIDRLAVKMGVDERALDKNLLAKGLGGLDEILTNMSKSVLPDNHDAIKIPLEILTGFLTSAVLKGGYKGIKSGVLKVNDLRGDVSRTNKLGPEAKIEFDLDNKSTGKIDTTGVPETKPSGKYNNPAIRTSEGTSLEIKTNSPAVTTTVVNPRMAKTLLDTALYDETGQVLSSLNLSLEGFLYHFGFPEATLSKKVFAEHVDMFESLKQIENLNIDMAKEYFLPESLVDTRLAENFLQDKVNVLNNANDGVTLTVAPSLGSFNRVGNGIQSSMVFRKTSIDDFVNATEVLESAKVLKNKITQTSKNSHENFGDIFIDHIDHNGQIHRAYTLENFEKFINTEGASLTEAPKFRIRWKQDADFFDTIKAASEGFGKHEFEASNKLLKSFVEATPLSGAFMKWGQFSAQFEKAYRRHGMRANVFFRQHLQLLKEKIDFKDKEFVTDLDRLYKEQQGVSDIFTINEIYSTLNYNFPKTRAVKLQEVLTLTRNIEKFQYEMLNKYELSVSKKEGYNHFVDLATESGEPYRVMVKDEFSLGDYVPDRVLEVWDPSGTGKGIQILLHSENMITGVQSVLLGEQQGRQILRLQKTFTDAEGRMYEYILRDSATDLTGPPNYIVPAKLGHMPMSMLSNFFVKRYPKEVILNGKRLRAPQDPAKLKGEWDRFASIEAAAQTEGQARTWLAKNADPANPEFIYEVVKASELTRADMIQGLKLFERHLKNSKKRSNKSIDNAIYGDLFSTFTETVQSTGASAYMLPLLDQFKMMFKEHYSKKLNVIDEAKLDANGFPRDKADIRSGDRKVQAQAIREWELINQLENGRPNYAGKWLASGFEFLADIADSTHPLETRLSKAKDAVAQSLRQGERYSSHLAGFPLRFTNTAKIALSNPLKMLQQQPIAVLGPMLLADVKALNTTMANAAGTVLAQMKLFDSYRKYNKLTDEVYKYAFDESKIFKSTETTKSKMNMLDQQMFLNELNKAGYLVIEEHIFSRGVFSATPEGLTSNRPGLTRRITEFNRDVGFTFGEWLHKVGMAHAARTLWIKNNPGKNWRSKPAMEEIINGADQLAASMHNYARYNWQNVPILNYIGQFGSFVMSASESIWNPAASPFNAKQRAALLAYNVFMFGTKYGTPYHAMGAGIEYMNQNGMGEIADLLDTPAFLNMVYRTTFDTVFPSYDRNGNVINSTMDPSSVWSPMGNSFLGAPGDILRATLDMLGIAEFSEAGIGASATTLKQIYHGFFEIGKVMYQTEMPAEDQAVVAFKELMKITSFGNGILNTMNYDYLNRKLNKYNQPITEEQSFGDRAMNLLSVPNQEQRINYDNWKLQMKSDDKIKQMSNLLFESVSLAKGKSAETIDYRQAFQAANEIMIKELGFSDHEAQQVWTNMMVLDNRKLKPGTSGVLDQIAKEHKIDNTASAEQVQRIRNALKQVRDPNQKRFLEILLHDYTTRVESKKEGE
jgi:hypothetical protein